MKQRIWELDVLRGLCILGMIAVHFIFDLVELYGLISWQYPPIFSLIMNWGGVLFILISGICATLGSRSLRRGLIVFGCGMLCTLVTVALYLLDFADFSVVIQFGVLHCLGLCMILWPLFRRLPPWALAMIGCVLVITGLIFRSLTVRMPLLFPLGLITESFYSADYFPLLPYLGFFLLGAFIGRTVYRKGISLLPRAKTNNPILGFLQFIGRQSLIIYLLHQPVLTLLFSIIMLFLKP